MKLSPQSLSTEDVYKLWTAFRARYRATAAYMASVVLIRRTHAARVGLPVQTRNILVQPAGARDRTSTALGSRLRGNDGST